MRSERFGPVSCFSLSAVGVGLCVGILAQLALFVRAQPPLKSGKEGIVIAEGMTGHIDPKTGKVVSPPPGAVPPPQSKHEKDATSTSSEGLKEELNPNGGGYKVDLKGRFQNR